MTTVLKVKNVNDSKLEVSYPADHPKKDQIVKWLKYLSPGYTEYMIRFGRHPHCDGCRDMGCENVGNGDDACPAFKYGDKW